jgi:hypothetical protein
MDVFTPIVLLVGGLLIPILGWALGVVLLWTSGAWTRRDKLIGTLVIPGGLMLPVSMLTVGLSASSLSCSGPVTTQQNGTFKTCGSDSLVVGDLRFMFFVGVAFIAPMLTTVYLIRRARSHRAEPAEPRVAV